ncbi:MAG: HIRAN domain-containing protein [Firmicutes bacterium]|nr:HIRAN domain-containing protein [Bacillota bacterium]
MDKIYFTITGTRFVLGERFLESATDFLKAGTEVKLVKEKDNEYDTEAILVRMPGLGKMGHVANSVRTRIGESYSAGRLYDKFDEEAVGVVELVLPYGILCSLKQD